MKNLILIIAILINNSSCQKSSTNEPAGIFVGKATIKTNIIKNNNDIVNLFSEEPIEIDFDRRIMKQTYCENSLQIEDNMGIIINQAIDKCPNNADCICSFSNDTATYVINGDIINIFFNNVKIERQYNYNEKDITTISRIIEVKKK